MNLIISAVPEGRRASDRAQARLTVILSTTCLFLALMLTVVTYKALAAMAEFQVTMRTIQQAVKAARRPPPAIGEPDPNL
jgi:hypothetical protein